MISFTQLLKMYGFDLQAKTKMVRHKDTRGLYDVDLLCGLGMLEVYQSYQHNEIFNCEYVISFVGLESTKARLYGIYRVNNKNPGPAVKYPCRKNFPIQIFWITIVIIMTLKKLLDLKIWKSGLSSIGKTRLVHGYNI